MQDIVTYPNGMILLYIRHRRSEFKRKYESIKMELDFRFGLGFSLESHTMYKMCALLH